MKACSFFGHRDTPQTEELKEKVREIVERLIIEEGVDTFLFGSRSKFDELCHMVVTELKEKYPHIQRIAYLCKHESGCLAGEGKKEQCRIKELTGRDVYVREFEDIKRSSRVNSAGRASYVERNYWMVDDSDFVIMYFKVKSEERLRSGVRVAYEYAKELLATTNLTTLSISSKLHFDSLSHFNHLFKREFNMTPSQYRKQKK